MVYLEYNSVKLLVLDDYSIVKSSQELTFSDIKCDFTGHSAEDLPEKYQEIKVISEEKTRELLFIGYLEDYVFDEMRELDIDTSINFTLITPKKITTLRTCIAVGTYQLKDLIENIILAPLIDDGFILKTLEITDRKITVNYLCKTIEYCLNNLSNKFNFWWYIDENKNKRLKLASYFALAKINTVLKINTAPISSIEEKVTFKKIKERIIEQSGSPTVKILASVGLK